MALSVSTGGQQAHTSMTVELFGFGSTPAVIAPAQSEVYDATPAALSSLGATSGG
jgi:hypothetical protein